MFNFESEPLTEVYVSQDISVGLGFARITAVVSTELGAIGGQHSHENL